MRTGRRSRGMKFTALVLALVLMLAACGGGNGNGGANQGGNLPAGILAEMGTFEEYAYLSTLIDLPQNNTHTHIDGSFAHGDRIYYFYTDHFQFPDDFDWDSVDWDTFEHPAPDLVIASVLADGSDFQETRITPNTESVQMPFVEVTEDGNFRLILVEREWDMVRGESTEVFLAEFDREGNELSKQMLDVVPPNIEWFGVQRAVVAADGYVVMSIWHDTGEALLIVGPDGNMLAELEVDWIRTMTRTYDGRVFAIVTEFDGQTHREFLREIDFAARDFGETLDISTGAADTMFTAPEGSPFDFFTSGRGRLFGLNVETGQQTLILDWIESDIAADWGLHVGFFDDGRISVLSATWSEARMSMNVELHILEQTSRSLIPEREVITLGGLGIWGEIRQQIVDFNRSSTTHRIAVTDYVVYSTSDNWNAGRDRLFAELAIGQGPDILWGGMFDMGTVIDRGFMMDLYPFIDNDPVINRTDFFPSVLAAMETSSGELSMLANRFGIQTMVGLREQVGHIDHWTLEAMQELIEEANARGVTHPLGRWMTREQFLQTALMFSGDQFFDWEAGRANLDNDDFIALIEATSRLPEDLDEEMMGGGLQRVSNWVSDHELILSGDQLLMHQWISGVSSIQELSGAFQDFVALGMPTPQGGGHVIAPDQMIGITATSQNQDAAWEFIRQSFLPDVEVPSWQFPIRIDLYEQMIAEAMVQEYWTDEDGVEHPVSMGGMGFGDGFFIDLFALTQEEANIMRELIDTANLTMRFDTDLFEMIMEEMLPFFAGDRSAADTARILENRIGIFMSERR